MEQNAAVELPLADRLWAWFDANGKLAIWSAIGLAVVGFIVSYYVWQQAQARKQASEALSETAVQLTLAGGGRDNAAEAYLKVAAAHPGTEAAGRAILQAGASLFVQARYAEAQAQFERFTREQADSPFIPQALLGVATSLEAQGKTEDAARAYEGLAKGHPGSAATPQAEFALANIYETQGRLQEAWFMFEKLARAGLNSSIGSEAGIRAEELKGKLPAAPAVSTPAASPMSSNVLSAPTAATTNQP